MKIKSFAFEILAIVTLLSAIRVALNSGGLNQGSRIGEPAVQSTWDQIGIDVLENIYSRPDVMIIDARHPELFARGHLPDAVLLNEHEVEQAIAARHAVRNIVIFGASPETLPPRIVAMLRLSHLSIHYCRATTDAWVRRGHPVSEAPVNH